MHANVQKTLYMLYKQKNKPEVQLNLDMTREDLTETNIRIYLGMVMDDGLTWKENLNKIRKKVMTTVEVFLQ